MKTIKITVRDKIATADGTKYICGNSGFEVIFDFDAEWDAFESKTARFVFGSAYVDVVFVGNRCAFPVISNTLAVQVGVFAGNLSTTTPAYIDAKKSILCGNGVPAAPPDDVYNQIMQMINDLGGASPEAIAAAVADYMAQHPIEETDPTVPEWAKADEKPAYTADEVGAVGADELPEAIDAALAQAKASGEFNGADGKDGADGKNGADGKDGADGKNGTDGKDGADGLTPHIGANGNWFVGDTDTGVSAGGNAAGEGETAWRKKQVTLSEGVLSIEVDIPSAKRVLVYALLRANDADNSLTTGSTTYKVKVNDYFAAHPPAYIRNGGGFYSFYDIEKVAGKTKLFTSYYDNPPAWSFAKNIQLNGWVETEKDKNETINSISISVADTKYVIAEGCFVEVFYK